MSVYAIAAHASSIRVEIPDRETGGLTAVCDQKISSNGHRHTKWINLGSPKDKSKGLLVDLALIFLCRR